MTSAVFLDRDGTLNREVGYLHRVADLRLVRGAAEAVALLNRASLKTVLVTNQAGRGRGYFAESCIHEVHSALAQRLAARGARLDAIYYCPHHPDDGCPCRKPMPGMLYTAARDLDIDLTTSFVVGDKLSDLEAGREAGCKTVLVLTGHGRAERARLDVSPWQPDLIAGSLRLAAPWILDVYRRSGPADGDRVRQRGALVEAGVW